MSELQTKVKVLEATLEKLSGRLESHIRASRDTHGSPDLPDEDAVGSAFADTAVWEGDSSVAFGSDGS